LKNGLLPTIFRELLIIAAQIYQKKEKAGEASGMLSCGFTILGDLSR
jgi:hypothetical protein